MKITLLHPSRGRAEKALQTLRYWKNKSSNLYEIEHILSIDMDDPQSAEYIKLFTEFMPSTKVIAETNDSVVAATNRAAKFATGDILIYLSDDFFPPQNWDAILQEFFENKETPHLVKVLDGIHKMEIEVLTIPIMNKQLYKQLGYFWHPGYRSMFVDEDLYHTCKKNGWMQEVNIEFTHEHCTKAGSSVPNDETYKRSALNWDSGKAFYAQRKDENFPLVSA